MYAVILYNHLRSTILEAFGPFDTKADADAFIHQHRDAWDRWGETQGMFYTLDACVLELSCPEGYEV